MPGLCSSGLWIHLHNFHVHFGVLMKVPEEQSVDLCSHPDRAVLRPGCIVGLRIRLDAAVVTDNRRASTSDLWLSILL